MTQPIRHVRPSHVDPVRMHLYQRAIWIAVLGNGALALAKGAAAWLSGSTALLATAVDSATDLPDTWGQQMGHYCAPMARRSPFWT